MAVIGGSGPPSVIDLAPGSQVASMQYAYGEASGLQHMLGGTIASWTTTGAVEILNVTGKGYFQALYVNCSSDQLVSATVTIDGVTAVTVTNSQVTHASYGLLLIGAGRYYSSVYSGDRDQINFNESFVVNVNHPSNTAYLLYRYVLTA